MSGFKRLELPTNIWRAGSIGSRKALPKQCNECHGNLDDDLVCRRCKQVEYRLRRKKEQDNSFDGFVGGIVREYWSSTSISPPFDLLSEIMAEYQFKLEQELKKLKEVDVK